MKKILGFLGAIFLIALFTLPSAVSLVRAEAVDSSKIAQTTLGGLFLGQNHYYYVIFRGNGEAIVYANIEFTNTTDNVLNKFTFETPVEARDMTIVQYKAVNCGYNYLYDATLKKCVYSADIPLYPEGISSKMTSDIAPYYGGNQNLYQKAKFTSDGNKYTVALPTDVAVDGKSYLILGYTTTAFTKEFWGGHEFEFESLKVNSRITQLRVGIEVDGGLLLKNSTGVAVAYASYGAEKSVASDTAVVNTDLDGLLSQMVYSGSITSTYKELTSGETVTISGEYASTWARLYMKEMCWIVGGIVGFFAIVVIAYKLNKRFGKKSEPDSTKSRSWIIVDTALGFSSALIVLLFTLAFMYMASTLTYSYYGYSGSEVVNLFVSIIIVLIYAFLVLFVPIFRGIKKGWASFGVVFFSELVFLVIMALILMSVLLLPYLYGGTPAYPV